MRREEAVAIVLAQGCMGLFTERYGRLEPREHAIEDVIRALKTLGVEQEEIDRAVLFIPGEYANRWPGQQDEEASSEPPQRRAHRRPPRD